MRIAIALSIVLLLTGAGAQQQGGLDAPLAPTPKLKIGEIDPKGQCSWIAVGRPELAPVEQACEAAVAGSETLPNFVCDLNMTRTVPPSRPEKITAELRYVDGEEDISNLTVGGKPVDKVPGGGIWTRGEFAPPGLSVLDGRSNPQFRFRGEENSPAGSFLAFDYKIAKESNEAWRWSIPPYEYRPAFHGTLLIDKQSGVLRRVSLEAEGDEIDAYVPTLSASVSTDYNQVKIGDLGSYLLPVHSELKSCGRFDRRCSTIVRNFVNCRKFAAKARIVE